MCAFAFGPDDFSDERAKELRSNARRSIQTVLLVQTRLDNRRLVSGRGATIDIDAGRRGIVKVRTGVCWNSSLRRPALTDDVGRMQRILRHRPA